MPKLDFDLPDFDDMMKLVDEITNVSARVKETELDIDQLVSNIHREAQVNDKYFVNGKPPSSTHVKACWETTGFDGELIPKRRELIYLETRLEKAKMQYEILRMQVDLYRTDSANKRAAVL